MATLRQAVITGASALCVLTLAACGGGGKGGDTTCGEYRDMSSSSQQSVIEDYLNGKGQSATTVDVLLYQGSISLYCMIPGSENDPIRRVDG